MPFPLMPGYDHINVVADLDPGAALRDIELGERIRDYPKLLPAGSPDFGHAVQTGTEWRIGSSGSSDPSSARYSLAFDLRRDAADLGEDPTAHAMRAAADRLDPEDGEQLPKDEWEIGDRRYRVIRMERFALIGDRTMEPPRGCDDTLRGDDPLAGHLIDPRAPAGHWEAQLRLNLVGFTALPSTASDAARTETHHAILTHPGVVLLPPSFTVVEVEGDTWRPLTGGDRPEEARRRLARHFCDVLPRLREFQGDPVPPAERARWAEASKHIEATTDHTFTIMDREFRILRISRMLRLGKDGPEAPRPSD
ncbi:hypothetical protein AGRA3207_002414 [Actinomadura graeca]|uniref:PE-PGRS family protein n=1 Tax=Actinomadura graeca TaxID=2750812 RepID=A0ABX8QS00_9ACTN|nr:DUF5954 family protein [Actinomadura graeca]QXJ21553.1 hypothetical protein AGRA3207_002414 [Actinomadura graeca]